MKKNKFLKIASGLLMLVLITCCAVSGTFAKYVTSMEGSDSATVAKWNVKITQTTNIDEAFKSTYTKDSDDAKYSAIVNSVVGDTDRVAPGTTGSVTITLQGTPEVAFELAFEMTGTDNIKYSNGVYPIKWSLTKNDAPVDGATNITLAEMIEKVNALSAVCDAGTPCDAKYVLSWSWAYFVDEATDKLDTELGDAGTATIAFTLKVTATQID